MAKAPIMGQMGTLLSIMSNIQTQWLHMEKLRTTLYLTYVLKIMEFTLRKPVVKTTTTMEFRT